MSIPRTLTDDVEIIEHLTEIFKQDQRIPLNSGRLIKYLRKVLDECNVDTIKCSCCDWIDKEMGRWYQCHDCKEAICKRCYDEYGNNKEEIFCEDCYVSSDDQ
jgi:hypothetical protein